MAGKRKTCLSLCGLALGVFVVGLGLALAEEGVGGRPEMVPVPPPQELTPVPPQYYPNATYGPLQAGEDAHRMAEQSRRWAIDRQLQSLPDLRVTNGWPPYVYQYALPYIYAYAPPRVARRVHRELDRHVPGLVVPPRPQVPGGIYGYPYDPRVQQPLGHEKIWTGPNGYVYRPRYPEPPVAGPAPTPAMPQRPTPAAPLPGRGMPSVATLPGGPAPPIPAPPIPGGLEPIPAPPSEPGPREF